MKTPLSTIGAVLAKRSLESDVDPKQFAREIAAYLLQTGRSGDLNSLVRDMVAYRAKQGVVEANVVGARELTDKARGDIRSLTEQLYPNAKRVILNEQEDPRLIGGARVELPDQQLDMTIRAKLNRFKALTSAERTN